MTCQVRGCLDGFTQWHTLEIRFPELVLEEVGAYLCKKHMEEVPVERISAWERPPS